MKSAKDKITALRALMEKHGLDAYIIPRSDEYQGEFVAPYAERLKWLTGFTGSAGIAVVTHDKACVLSDGRYTLQLREQVDADIFETADSVKLGAQGWLKERAADNAVIGYDPWLHTPDQIERIKIALPDLTLKALDTNLIDQIWSDQPEKPQGRIQPFDENLAGKSFLQKKKHIVEEVGKQGANAIILTMPDSISWLLNMRGEDIDYIPYILSYAIIHADQGMPVQWIVDESKIHDIDLDTDIDVTSLKALVKIKFH